MTIHYSISSEVFDKFPGFCRGVVVATGLTNGPAPAELTASLREAEAALPSMLNMDTILENPENLHLARSLPLHRHQADRIPPVGGSAGPARTARRTAAVHQHAGGYRHAGHHPPPAARPARMPLTT